MRNFPNHLGKIAADTRGKLKFLFFAWSEPERQARAIRKMGLAGNPQDAPLLIESLDQNYHPTVRAEAARALGALRCDSATLQLIALLEDPIEMVQSAAAAALGQIGDQRAIQSLVSMLKHPSDSIRNTAAEAVPKLGPEAIGWIGELLKKSSFETRIAAAWTLGKIRHERAFFALEKSLGDTDSMVRREVASALAKQSRQAAERLCAHLGSENPLVRHTAALALLELHAPQSVEPLVNHLKLETQPDVREVVWKALAACRWEPALRRCAAQEAIDTGNWARAEKAGAAAVDPFLELFRRGDAQSKKIAEDSLPRIGLAGQEALQHALSDPEQSVRRLAARVLTQLNWKPPTQQEDLRLKIVSGKYPEARCAAALPLLLQMLSDQTESEREAATETLGQIAAPEALEALARAVADPSARVRLRAALALAANPAERSRQILENLAKDLDYNVASAAQASLRSLIPHLSHPIEGASAAAKPPR